MEHAALVGISNELDADGWCRLAPYGQSLKTVRQVNASGGSDSVAYIQVLDKDGAVDMAKSFNGLWGRFKRAITSVPLFEGHPDLARLAPKNVDAPPGGKEVPVGTLNRLEARDDGIYAQVGLFPAGQALANEGHKFISPFWWSEPVEKRGEVIVVRPVELISGGLTKRPNIPGGEPLANQGTPGNQPQHDAGSQSVNPKTESTMKQFIIGLLAARGIALANDVSEQDLLTKTASVITTLEGQLTTAAADKTALANEKSTIIIERDSAKNALSSVTTERDTARTALANEKLGRSEALVDLAITQGKVALADRATRIKALTDAADFSVAATALANEQVKHSTTGNNLGTRRSDATAPSPREQLVALENDARYVNITDYNARFDAILRDHPQLKASLQAKSA